MGRWAGIDWGLANIGLAISDERKIVARSLGRVKAAKRASDNAALVAKALKEYGIEGIIVGMPVHFNGKAGYLADEVGAFIAELKQQVSCPIIAWEERLSTVQAEKALREAGLSRKKRSSVIDGVTAVILLQNYLDYLAFTIPHES